MKPSIFIKIGLMTCLLLSFTTLFGQTVAQPPVNFTDENAGTHTNPYQIATLANLRWLSETVDVWGGFIVSYTTNLSSLAPSYPPIDPITPKYFIQTDDIDASETRYWNNGRGFSPIGKQSMEYVVGSFQEYLITVYPFQGSYDGGNHIIRDLYLDYRISNPGNQVYTGGTSIPHGMFGIVWNSTIANIRLVYTNPDLPNALDDYSRIGRLVCTVGNSSIINCSASGSMNKSVGLIYYMLDNSLMEYCYSVTHHERVASSLLANYAQNSIVRNSYALGQVLLQGETAGAFTQGLVGRTDNVIISNVYIASNDQTTNVNRISKFLNNSTVTNSRWDTQSSNAPNPEEGFYRIVSSTIDDCIGFDTDAMKDPAYYPGWDFENIWAIDPTINDGFPHLRQDNIIQYLTYNDQNTIPATSILLGNYPNPFNPETTIRFSIGKDSWVDLGIYNVKGQLVRTLASDVYQVGTHQVIWNGKNDKGQDVSSGVYFFKMTTDKYTETRKMMLLK